MLKRKIFKNSVIVKIGFAMIFILLFQAFCLIALLVSSGLVETMENFAYQSFTKTLQNRAVSLEKEMAFNWANITSFSEKLVDDYNKILDVTDTINEEEINVFLDDSLPVLLNLVHSNHTSGSFVIFDYKTNIGRIKPCIFLYNQNPSDKFTDNNIQLLKGPSQIALKYNLPFANTWCYGIPLLDEHIDILKKPIDAYNNSDTNDALGYWYISTSYLFDRNSTLTYSLPLVDKNGNTFGVIGTAISLDYLYEFLPNNDFYHGSYGYTLGKKDNNGNIVPFFSQGTAQDSILKVNKPLNLQLINEKNNCYQLNSVIDDVAVSFRELNLYSSSTAFDNDDIFLIGLFSKNEITYFSRTLENTLFLIILFSLITAVFSAYYIGRKIALPIVKLNKKVTSYLPGDIVELNRTGIREIDELASSIESFGKHSYDKEIKNDQILKMINSEVGSFEYQIDSKLVSVSSSLVKMLELKTINNYQVEMSVFLEELELLKKFPEEDFENIYLVSLFPEKWYRITTHTINNSVLGIILNVTNEVLERKALNYERDYDMLTGINNRLSFYRKSYSVLAKYNLDIAAVVMFDLDNLKYVNDSFGHELGDIYIKTAARFMQKAFSETGIVGRISGDEFLAFVYKNKTKNDILDNIQLLYDEFDKNPITLPDSTSFKVRISSGLAWYKDDSYDFKELVRYADFAMYQVKHTLKGELRVFNKDIYIQESFMLNGREELNRILDNQFVNFVFQPIIDVKTCKIYSYEALMRPQSDILDTPLKLLQIATAQTQLWKIEKITFFKVLSLYKKYQDLFGDCKLFINSVPNEVLKESEYNELEMIYGDVLENVVVEIIENERLNSDILKTKIDRFYSWGAKIALDDYGTGYNGDLNLLKINPSIVKIDKSLIEHIEYDLSRQAILAKTLSFCKERGIKVLAEGVETFEQMKYLVEVGVDYLQGYYISRPRKLPDFDPATISRQIKDILLEQNIE